MKQYIFKGRYPNKYNISSELIIGLEKVLYSIDEGKLFLIDQAIIFNNVVFKNYKKEDYLYVVKGKVKPSYDLCEFINKSISELKFNNIYRLRDDEIDVFKNIISIAEYYCELNERRNVVEK